MIVVKNLKQVQRRLMTDCAASSIRQHPRKFPSTRVDFHELVPPRPTRLPSTPRNKQVNGTTPPKRKDHPSHGVRS